MDKIFVSIGICAVNEEANIGKLLHSLQSQKTERVEINHIVVVSSACTDRTDEIVNSFHQTDPRIVLIQQAERKGKASAINLFLEVAQSPVLVLVSADTILKEESIEQLCLPFSDSKTGMTGGRPIPVDDPSRFMGFVVHFIWQLHHRIASITPKLGEVIAFRNIIAQLPENTAVDEASIEWLINERGLHIKYVPQALVYNKGAATARDFLKQRRRIYAGHLWVRKTTGYEVATMNPWKVMRLTAQCIQLNPKSIIWSLGAVIMESYARFLGAWDFHIKRENPYIWDIATSTKSLNHVKNIDSNPPV